MPSDNASSLIYIYVYKKISIELREFFKIISLVYNATLH